MKECFITEQMSVMGFQVLFVIFLFLNAFVMPVTRVACNLVNCFTVSFAKCFGQPSWGT